MSTVLLIRHAEADFSYPRKWNTLGWGADLAPLTDKGKEQAAELAPRLWTWQPDIVLSSPTTRTLSTALIACQRSDKTIPFQVEFDLHEWVPDHTFGWQHFSQVLEQLTDMKRCGGEWPDGERRPWEPLSAVRRRVLAVLENYRAHSRIAVICHGGVIWSLTGAEEIDNCEMREIVV